MLKMSTVVVLVTVLLLVVCAEAAGSKRKQVSTTLKMTAQRNDTGIWTAQFGDYEMVIEHRHFGKPAEGSKLKEGTWTMKLKHTVTEFPDDEDGDNDDEDFFKDDTYSSQISSLADEQNEVKPSAIKSQRKRPGKLDVLSNTLRELDPKKHESKAHSSAKPTPVHPSENGGINEAEIDNSYILPDNGNLGSQRSLNEYEENQDETRFEDDQNIPEVSQVPRFEALRSPNPEDETNVETAQTDRTLGTPLKVQKENNLAPDEVQNFNANEANNTPTLPQNIYQELEEVIERTVGHPQRRVQDSPDGHEVHKARKQFTVNQERIPTDTQLEVPFHRGDPSSRRNPSPWPTLTSTYDQNQQKPMTSDVAYDDVEAESAAAAQQEEDEDDLALAQEKKLVMERFPRSRSLPPYNIGYEHYPGVGWFKLNTSYWQWPEARKACEVEGAHLAVPNSERKVRIFQEIMGRHSYVVERAVLKNQVYVGVYTPDRYRRFTTVLGEPFHPGFPIWFDNEPNNADPGEECVTLHVMGRIRDVPCFYNLPFLCEIREH